MLKRIRDESQGMSKSQRREDVGCHYDYHQMPKAAASIKTMHYNGLPSTSYLRAVSLLHCLLCLLFSPELPRLLKHAKVQREPFTHPDGPLRMISLVITRIRMHQHAQRASPDIQPRHKRAKLLGREQIDLEHADWVRTHGPLEHGVDAQLWELVPDALPQLVRVFDLLGVALQEVDVQIETAADAVGDGIRERRVCGRLLSCWWVDEGFTVFGLLTE